MYWHYPEVKPFWETASFTPSKLFEVIYYCPKVFFLNDTSALTLSSSLYHVLFADLTAAKKDSSASLAAPSLSDPFAIFPVRYPVHGTVNSQNAQSEPLSLPGLL